MAYSLGASTLFAVLMWWVVLLKPLSGLEVVGWRILATLAFTMVLLTLVGNRADIYTGLTRIARPPIVLVHMLTAPLLAVQFWLFMWAPANGHAAEISLGFFLMPLVMVPVGRVCFGDRLSPWQSMAVTLAVIGVGHEVLEVGGIPWVSVVPALGFPLYFAIRRAAGISDIPATITDLTLMVPIAIICLALGWTSSWVTHPALFASVAIMGLLSAGATVAYLLAAHLLPFGLFGLLSYVEPVLLLVVALLLGESLTLNDLFTYGPIWLAIALLAIEGAMVIQVHRRTRTGLGLEPPVIPTERST